MDTNVNLLSRVVTTKSIDSVLRTEGQMFYVKSYFSRKNLSELLIQSLTDNINQNSEFDNDTSTEMVYNVWRD